MSTATTVQTPVQTTMQTTMRAPWRRLRADRRPGTTVLAVVLAAALAFFTSSTLVQFDDGWELWPALTGGVAFPVVSVLLMLPNPVHYRTAGLSMGQWRLDHGILVALAAVAHLAWPVWALVNQVPHARQVPAWAPALPAVAVIVTVALVLHYYRHLLTGRATGAGQRFTTTPLAYRVFLARRGPVAWRTVYQPVGTVALVAVTVISVWVTVGGDDPYDGQIVTAGFLLAALVTAPVVAASRATATAVGMTRRAWVRDTLLAVSVPQAVVGVVTVLVTVPINGQHDRGLPLSSLLGGTGSATADLDYLQFSLYLTVVVATAVVAGAFAVSVSYEDWGTAIMWLIFFNLVTTGIPLFGFTSSTAAWPSAVAAAAMVVLAFFLTRYARARVLLGQPDWSGTGMIAGTRTA